MAQPDGHKVSDAAKELDEKYRLVDIRAKAIAEETPQRGFPLNPFSLQVVRRRCLEAKDAGHKNIAVDINLLIELMNGTHHAFDKGFTTDLTI